MRTLCLNLNPDEKRILGDGWLTNETAIAENFLAFSPRVHYRHPGLVFVDISSPNGGISARNERQLLEEAQNVSQDFFPKTTAAIADSPWLAQLFCREKPSHISPPARELSEIDHIPLARLHDLEGLIAWRSTSEVEGVIDFFHQLGVNRLGEIKHFQIDAFRERWHDTGTLIWKRLHGLDKQVISPLVPATSLKDYVHLDFPVSLLSFLLHCLERSLGRLTTRLERRGEFARKIIVQLFCEYSGRCHLIELSPASPNRSLELFIKLLENKMSELCLDNPIKEFEVEVIPCPEKVQQLGFWEPAVSDRDKLNQLISVFQQAQLTSGYLKPKDEMLPEDMWEITSEYEVDEPIDDAVEINGASLQVRPSYAASIREAPRPSRLLKRPRRLNERSVKSLEFLSSQPVERIEHGWWETSRGRDYYFAVSPKGQFLWVYYDRIEDEYFLQGYFD